LFREVFHEDDRARRSELLIALAGARDVGQQTATLGLVLDDRLDIRDTAFVFFGAQDEANRVVAQRYFQDHQDAILKRIPSDGTAQGQAWLAGMFTTSCVPERRAEIVDYVTRTFAGMPGGARAVQQSIEAMDHCIARRQLLDPEIRSWLGGKPGGKL